ncbi:MAG: MotA/TolQ/ExbB proton channel family protein [Elusimicrobia bacterium]|nr:MotA/TolQ/ExbB proton channel family protein [Elusimicrobiota bacterium]
MDFATILGILVFAGLVVASVFLSEGVAGFKPFLNIEAVFVVLGGTFCATLVNYPLSQVAGLGRVLRKVLFSSGEDTSEIVTTFVSLSQKAKKEGFLALEGDVKKITNDFLQRGVQLVVDGADHEFIRNMLETEIGFIRERHKIGREIFNALGTYAPAFGIIGTVLGMILMLNGIDDVGEVPRRMALALAAAFYGLGAGYLLFLPMAGKLRRRSDEELLVKEIVIRGVLLLQTGAAPSMVEANLKAYLEPAKRVISSVTGQGRAD